MTAAPTTDIDPRFGIPEATATPWATAEAIVESAELWWITTVRADGRPHVTPLLAVWDDGALHVTTGPGEQKAVNLRANDRVALTTGVNTQDDGLDVVVHGRAVRVTDPDRLRRLADAWVAKYGEDWRFTPVDGTFTHGDDGEHVAHVFAVAPTEAFGFAKGAAPAQTRWRWS
jgi:nitroimidazol reductase NimA-like FMN-containing flavoprotein (pyridoxamine 5'-phosphate oxidase superfamily)